jgi:hypothetical protein
MITQLMQLIMQAPILQQAYGAGLPNMVAHLAQLGGVRGLDEYNPQVQSAQQGIPGQLALPAQLGDPVQQNTENSQKDQTLALRQQALQLRQQELTNRGEA